METDVRDQEDRQREEYEAQQEYVAPEGEEAEAEAEAADSVPAVEPSAPLEEPVTATTVKHKVVLTVQDVPAIKKAINSALRLNRRMAYEIKEVAEHDVEDTVTSGVPAAEEAPEEDNADTRTRLRVAEALQELGSADDHHMDTEGSPPPSRRRRRSGWWRLLFCAKTDVSDDSNPPTAAQRRN